MYKLATILLLAPAALAGLVSPLQERQASCESPRTLCGDTCIGPLDICCPAAPNGQVIACGSTDNCWINPDNSPGCCPLFTTCAGQKAGSGVFPTLPSNTVTTASSTPTPVAPEPTISIPPPQQTATASSSSIVTISTVKSVTVPCSARPSSTKPGKTSTPYVSSSTAVPTGSGSGSGHGSGSGSGSASPSASPLFNGASSSSISVGGILGAMVLGLFL
ncbi:uncharacterized protein N7473_009420 [Penicillium subrubescens]|uniref:GPI anchored serine-threonine rich protein n=1 Tax=Penicillium subrubescens TaxID=1316194 RepID=A0A1Q5TB34_9EURO|nr:uncharacterized protein N7473_009420 [Penicillium subrubescens]KAJ5886746.1 hypothetical protein N7473_009420 [Penicillium subrubescens]OKO97417.1 hypothetical protein PENSUB_10211 [Penicillium subrubescens]